VCAGADPIVDFLDCGRVLEIAIGHISVIFMPVTEIKSGLMEIFWSIQSALAISNLIFGSSFDKWSSNALLALFNSVGGMFSDLEGSHDFGATFPLVRRFAPSTKRKPDRRAEK